MFKKNVRRLLALISAISLTATSSIMLAPQVIAVASGGAVETLPTGFTGIQPIDFGFANDTYEATTNTQTPVTSMHQVRFETDITYQSGAGISYMRDASTTDKTISINGSGGALRVWNSLSYDTGDTKFYVDGIGYSYYDISPSTAIGEATFYGNKFHLTITTEYVDYDNDNNTNDIKIGLWFDGTLYNQKYIYVKNCASTCQAYLALYKVTVESEPTQTPVSPEDFTELKPIAFGIADNTKYTTETPSTLSPTTTMHQMRFEADVTYHAGGGIYYLRDASTTDKRISINYSGGAIRVWNSLSYDTGDTKFYVDGVGYSYYDISPSAIEKATFENEKFHLTITTEYVDYDEDGNENDIKIGLWFNEDLYNDKYIYVKNCATTCQAYLAFTNVTVGTPVEEEPPVSPEDFTELTLTDFGIADNTKYTTDTPSTLTPTTTMHQMRFEADVTYHAGGGIYYLRDASTTDKRISINYSGGALRVWNSLSYDTGDTKFYVDGVGYSYYDISPSAIEKATFENEKFHLTITTEYVDYDDDGNVNDIKIGLWFNEDLYNDKYIYVKNCATTCQAYLAFTNVTVGTPSNEEEDDDPVTFPTEFTELKPGAFGVADNTKYTMVTPSTLTPTTTMHQMRFEADVTYHAGGGISYMKDASTADKTISVNYSGGALRLWNSLSWDTGDTKFYVDGVGYSYYDVSPSAIEKATFEDEKFHLTITTEYVDYDDDGNANDIKIGLWFNENLYNDKYIYVKNCATTCQAYLALGNVTVGTPTIDDDVPEEILPTDFIVIEPVDFGIYNDTYKGTTVGILTPVNSMNKVLFQTDITYQSGAGISYMRDASTTDKTISINFSGGALRLWNSLSWDTGDTHFYVNGVAREYVDISPSAIEKTTFENEKFHLSITTEYVDYDEDGKTNDIKIGLWFNGTLYNNLYIYVKNCATTCQAHLSLTKVAVETENGEAPVIEEPDLPEITFSDFRVEDGTYSYTNNSLATVGKWKKGIANYAFVGIVNFTSETGSSINFGGMESAWEGVKLVTMGDGTLYFAEAYDRFTAIAINPEDVAVPILDKDVEVKIAFEVVDLDDDKQKDDVRFWLYFNDELYQGRPIRQMLDYAQYLGTFLGVYSNNEESSVTIKSKDLNRPKVEVDFSIVGFTKDWKKTLASGSKNTSDSIQTESGAPYTGDRLPIGTYMLVSALLLSVLIMIYDRKKNVRG